MKLPLLRAAFGTACILIATAFTPQAVAAQCNHCDNGGCTDGHWDNCGFGGPGHNWTGDCDPGCEPGDCSGHTGSCLAALDYPGAIELVESRDWASLAKAAMSRQIDFDRERGVVYVRSCTGGQLVGQIPLLKPAVVYIAGAIETRRLTLLAELDPE